MAATNANILTLAVPLVIPGPDRGSNSRLVGLDEHGITFRYKDYRSNGRERFRTMTLAPGEFIRRFLLHVLPNGFHRIRHYGGIKSNNRWPTEAGGRVRTTMA